MRRSDNSPIQDNSGSNSRRRVPYYLALMLLFVAALAALMTRPAVVHGSSLAVDPGPRPLPANAGNFYTTLTANQNSITTRLTQIFTEVNFVAGGPLVKTVGLGPRFNSNSCSSCHAYPAVGGSSPPNNPLFGIYQLQGATNSMPYFVTANGPVKVARFPYKSDLKTPDGGVHQMFTISNRTDAPGCTTMVQPDFTTAQQTNNIIFRQTTPTYGTGLMELIQESDIINNMNANQTLKQSLGISGHPNYSDDDGTITRFGWKAQNKSLLYFAGEAYTVEEGVSDEAFPSENDESIPSCLPPFPVPPGTNKTKGVPDDRNDTGEAPKAPVNFPGDLERFSLFMRFLAPPTPAASTQSTINGLAQFNAIGCNLCHNNSFTTPASSIAALSNVQANLYSDLLVHHMGPGLADNVGQGNAGGDEFRSAPLWGIGQRYFFLHDGRTTDIVQAIEDHRSTSNGVYPDSEANQVINSFDGLSQQNQQDLVNFLRSL
ncbi:MAG TPA: di-heme oxidoredictase family protein [Candidatus Dormibacteraeota bacterium]|nr:di-heme oxidoredictase family protein [Candidatus Dormibacteraeota bacterium]